MQTHSGLPTSNALRELLNTLLGSPITCTALPSPSAARPEFVALYENGDGLPEAYIGFDRTLVAYAGGALTMMPVDEVKATLQAPELSSVLVDGYREVVNIAASLFNVENRPHVKLRSTYTRDALPPDVVALLDGHGDQIHLKITIEGYGSGEATVFVKMMQAFEDASHNAQPASPNMANASPDEPGAHAPSSGASSIGNRPDPRRDHSAGQPGSFGSPHNAFGNVPPPHHAPGAASPSGGWNPPPPRIGARDSAPKFGSDDFDVQLQSASSSHNTAESNPVLTGQLRVLIVEDDAMTRMLLKTLLLRGQHQTLEAATAQEAFMILAQTKVDLVLIDIRLPDMSGVELAKYLKADLFTQHTPLIICSAVADRDVVVQAASLKVAGYLLKPITGEKLYQKLAEVGPRMVPVLGPPQESARRLGLGMVDFRRLLSAFLDEGQEILQGLYTAVKGADSQQTDFLTYRLGVSASQLGAHALVEAARMARITARSGDTPDAAPLDKHLMNLYLELKRLNDAIHDHFSLRNTFKRREDQVAQR